MATQKDTSNSMFSVFLNDHDDNVVAITMAIRKATGLSVKDARDLVDSAPGVVAQFVDMPPAAELVSAIENAGGAAIVTDHSGTPTYGSHAKDLARKVGDAEREAATVLDDLDFSRICTDEADAIADRFGEIVAIASRVSRPVQEAAPAKSMPIDDRCRALNHQLSNVSQSLGMVRILGLVEHDSDRAANVLVDNMAIQDFAAALECKLEEIHAGIAGVYDEMRDSA